MCVTVVGQVTDCAISHSSRAADILSGQLGFALGVLLLVRDLHRRALVHRRITAFGFINVGCGGVLLAAGAAGSAQASAGAATAVLVTVIAFGIALGLAAGLTLLGVGVVRVGRLGGPTGW